MKQSIKNLIIILFLISACKNAASETENTSKKDSLQSTQKYDVKSFKGEVFYIAPELDSLTTKAIARVDCTSSHIVFLTDSTFAEIAYCETNTIYLKGTYKIQNNSLIFNTSKTLVNKEYLDRKFVYSTETREEEETIIFKILNIKNKIVLKNDTRYGTIDDDRNYKIEINILKSEPIWSMLKP